MKLSQISAELGFERLTKEIVADQEVSGLYCADLLSWVMAHAKTGHAWITVQVHNNILAVASLLDLSCIIIPEGIQVDPAIIAKADEEDITIFSTPLTAYEVFQKFYEAGLR